MCLCVCLLGIYSQLRFGSGGVELWWPLFSRAARSVNPELYPTDPAGGYLQGAAAPHLWIWVKMSMSQLCSRQAPNKTCVPCSPRAVGAEKISLLLLYVPKSFISLSVSLLTDPCPSNACEQNIYLRRVFSFTFLKYKNYQLYQSIKIIYFLAGVNFYK